MSADECGVSYHTGTECSSSNETSFASDSDTCDITDREFETEHQGGLVLKISSRRKSSSSQQSSPDPGVHLLDEERQSKTELPLNTDIPSYDLSAISGESAEHSAVGEGIDSEEGVYNGTSALQFSAMSSASNPIEEESGKENTDNNISVSSVLLSDKSTNLPYESRLLRQDSGEKSRNVFESFSAAMDISSSEKNSDKSATDCKNLAVCGKSKDKHDVAGRTNFLSSFEHFLRKAQPSGANSQGKTKDKEIKSGSKEVKTGSKDVKVADSLGKETSKRGTKQVERNKGKETGNLRTSSSKKTSYPKLKDLRVSLDSVEEPKERVCKQGDTNLEFFKSIIVGKTAHPQNVSVEESCGQEKTDCVSSSASVKLKELRVTLDSDAVKEHTEKHNRSQDDQEQMNQPQEVNCTKMVDVGEAAALSGKEEEENPSKTTNNNKEQSETCVAKDQSEQNTMNNSSETPKDSSSNGNIVNTALESKVVHTENGKQKLNRTSGEKDDLSLHPAAGAIENTECCDADKPNSENEVSSHGKELGQEVEDPDSDLRKPFKKRGRRPKPKKEVPITYSGRGRPPRCIEYVPKRLAQSSQEKKPRGRPSRSVSKEKKTTENEPCVDPGSDAVVLNKVGACEQNAIHNMDIDTEVHVGGSLENSNTKALSQNSTLTLVSTSDQKQSSKPVKKRGYNQQSVKSPCQQEVTSEKHKQEFTPDAEQSVGAENKTQEHLPRSQKISAIKTVPKKSNKPIHIKDFNLRKSHLTVGTSKSNPVCTRTVGMVETVDVPAADSNLPLIVESSEEKAAVYKDLTRKKGHSKKTNEKAIKMAKLGTDSGSSDYVEIVDLREEPRSSVEVEVQTEMDLSDDEQSDMITRRPPASRITTAEIVVLPQKPVKQPPKGSKLSGNKRTGKSYSVSTSKFCNTSVLKTNKRTTDSVNIPDSTINSPRVCPNGESAEKFISQEISNTNTKNSPDLTSEISKIVHETLKPQIKKYSTGSKKGPGRPRTPKPRDIVSERSLAEQSCDNSSENRTCVSGVTSNDQEIPSTSSLSADEQSEPLRTNEADPCPLNLLEPHDQLLRLDNYPNTSPDSGIQSLAGSPAGNESPNSIILNEAATVHEQLDIAESLNSSTQDNSNICSVPLEKTDGKPSDVLENALVRCTSSSGKVNNLSDLEFSGESKGVPVSVITSAGTQESDSKDLSKKSSPVKDTAQKERTFSSNQTHSANNLTDSTSLSSTSPSKKQNRAKFLHLHKSSTLLQKGRLPTEEEKEQRLEDKFSYLEKLEAAAGQTEQSNPTKLQAFNVSSGNGDHNTRKLQQGENQELMNKIDSRMVRHSELDTDTSKLSNGKPSPKRRGRPPRKKKESVELNLITEPSDVDALVPKISGSKEDIVLDSDISTSAESEKKDSTEGKANEGMHEASVDLVSSSEFVYSSSELGTSVDHLEESASKVASSDKALETQSDTAGKLHDDPKSNEDRTQQQVTDFTPVSTTSNGSCSPKATEVPLKRRPGRPKGSKNKRPTFSSKNKISKLTAHKYAGAPFRIKPGLKKKPGRKPKMIEKIKNIKRKPGRPKGSKNKPKPPMDMSGALLAGVRPGEVHKTMVSPMMQWRESREQSGLDQFEEQVVKRKPGRPRKYPEGTKRGQPQKKSIQHMKKYSEKKSHAIDSMRNNISIDENEFQTLIQSVQDSIDNQFHSTDKEGRFNEFELAEVENVDQIEPSIDPAPQASQRSNKSPTKVKKPKLHVMMRTGKKKRPKTPKVFERPVEEPDLNLGNLENLIERYPELEKPNCSSVIFAAPENYLMAMDSDTSGASSGLSVSSLQWFLEEHRRRKKKKNKKKLLYFRSKHKNIIDPVFISQVDFLVNDFPDLSISPPGETYLRVKPGEVPLPSIFKITKFNVKKKKKEKVVQFEKAKRLKTKNYEYLEFTPRDRLKFNRRRSFIEELSPSSSENNPFSQHCNLPPKKRHKLFPSLSPEEQDQLSGDEEEEMPVQEKKKGRPKKNHTASTVHSPFTLGAEGFSPNRNDGLDHCVPMATFASVAAELQNPDRVVSLLQVSCAEDASLTPDQNNASAKETIVENGSTEERVLTASSEVHLEEGPSQSPDTCDTEDAEEIVTDSCADCSELQTECNTDTRREKSQVQLDDKGPNSPASVVAGKIKKRLNQSLKKARKFRRTRGRRKPLTRLKKSVKYSRKFSTGSEGSSDGRDVTERSGENLCNNDSVEETIDSVIRSVCSESEPLPLCHRLKRKSDGVASDIEEEVPEKRKKRQQSDRITSCSESQVVGGVSKTKFGTLIQKKKFQKAGLFSDTYKDDDSCKARQKERCPNGNQDLLPAPIHIGKFIFREELEFQLPYDVWYLHNRNMLPKKGDGQQYRRIRNNVYVDTRPPPQHEPHVCICRRPQNPEEKACGDDCLNRMIYTECTPGRCPVDDICTNQCIQKHDWAPGLVKFQTRERGWGVKATKPISAGDMIVEYCGEVVTEQEFRRRMTEEYARDCHHYCLNLDSGLVIDGYRMGNIARFVNHSCEPNCEMQKWNVNGTYHMCLFALKDIGANTELSYDYNFHSFNQDSQQKCKCGSSKCRGVIGGKFQRNNGQPKERVTTNRPGRPAKDKRKSKQRSDKFKETMKQKKLAQQAHAPVAPPPTSVAASIPSVPMFPPMVMNSVPRYFTAANMKPISKKEKTFARSHSIFLIRNLDRARQEKKKKPDETEESKEDSDNFVKGTHFTKRDVFITQFTALKTARNVKTRRLTLAEEDSEMAKIARLAQIFKEIFAAVASCKDDDGNLLAADLFHLPSRKKHPYYYDVIEEPIDLKTIEKNILSGIYKDVEAFERDFFKLFHNVEVYCGKKSAMGQKIKNLRLVYHSAKQEGINQLGEILGEENVLAAPSESDASEDNDKGKLVHRSAEQEGVSQLEGTSEENVLVAPTEPEVLEKNYDKGKLAYNTAEQEGVSQLEEPGGEMMLEDEPSEPDISQAICSKEGDVEDEEEEIIRCICNIYRDEGLMIQCEKCLIWQHTDCVGVSGDVENYLCELCDPRPYDKEVKICAVPGAEEEESDGCTYYMTLMRDDMQIRVGSCVYVMRENQSRRYSYKKSSGFNREKMDIFRIERLWKDEKGERFAFGYLYARPHETFHEPTRKFYPNEVFRTPLYELVPLEAITGYCCVMDQLTFCKGRPKGYKEIDIYICEYRLDKSLHLFYKIPPRQRIAINTKSYCFDMFEQRLNPKRTYSPHEVPEAYKKHWREKNPEGGQETTCTRRKGSLDSDSDEDLPLVKVKENKRKEKRERVNRIMDSLLENVPGKAENDLAYLMEEGLGRRHRKKITSYF